MAEQDLDRSHEATAHKLEQARRRGSVPRSADVTQVALLAVALVWCYAMALPAVRDWSRWPQRWWDSHAWLPLDVQRVGTLLAEFGLAAAGLLAPLCLALAVVAILANLVQTGPVFSAEPLKPDLERLNPMAGLKRLMSLKTLYLALRSVIKLALLVSVFWWALQALWGSFLALSWLPAKASLLRLPDLMGGLLAKLWLVLLVLALVDLIYTRWEFARQMRMSAREIKDEAKNREGDPRLKRRLRELRVERLRQSQAMRRLPGADVLITNPTRLAVAIRYDRRTQAAPTLVAKGAGGLARQMREVAARHAIPIVQNAPLARALYRQMDIDSPVPEAWYPVLARILVWVYAGRAQRAGSPA